MLVFSVEKLKAASYEAVAILKRYFQFGIAFALLIILIAVVYGDDFQILINEALQSEALSHILLLPFLAGFLFYLKKDTVRASLAIERSRKKSGSKRLDEAMGVALCLIAFVVYWYGSFTFNPLEYHILSLPIFLMGVTLVLLNLKALITLILPMLFLLFLIPPPIEIVSGLGGAMGNFNTQASYFLLKTVGMPVELSSTYGPPIITLVSTATGQPSSFTIDLPCSGVYSLLAFAMFAAFLALIASGPIWKKVLLFVFGFLIFETLNILRITTVITAAYQFGEEIAMLIFHNVAGLILIFTGMLIVLLIADRFLRIQVLPKAPTVTPCRRCKTAVRKFQDFCLNCGRFLAPIRTGLSKRLWIKLSLLMLGCSIFALSVSAPTFVFSEEIIDLSQNSGVQNTTSILPQISGYQNATFVYRDVDYERMAHQDAAVWYVYTNKSKPTVHVGINVASSITNLHNWEVCLVGWQTAQGQYPLVSVLDSRDVQLLQGIPLIARFLVFKGLPEMYNYTQVTLYWYETAVFDTGDALELRYFRINLIIMAENSTEFQRYEDELSMIGQNVASYWGPLKVQSFISLSTPAQQLLLVLLVAFVAIAKISQVSSENRRKANNREVFDRHASPRDKLILNTTLKLIKERKAATTEDIKKACKERMGKAISLTKLVDTLTRFAEYGFIRKSTDTIHNVPKVVWKA